MAKASPASEIYVIELRNLTCSPVSFPPLQCMLRSEFSPDAIRLKDSASHERMGSIPGIIPGQRIELHIEAPTGPLGKDASRPAAQGRVVEPLHLAEHASLKSWIERLPARLEPQAELAEVDGPTWIFWMARLVEDGLAVVVTGEKFPTHDVCKRRFGEPAYSGLGQDPKLTKRRALADQLLEALLDKIGASELV